MRAWRVPGLDGLELTRATYVRSRWRQGPTAEAFTFQELFPPPVDGPPGAAAR